MLRPSSNSIFSIYRGSRVLFEHTSLARLCNVRRFAGLTSTTIRSSTLSCFAASAPHLFPSRPVDLQACFLHNNRALKALSMQNNAMSMHSDNNDDEDYQGSSSSSFQGLGLDGSICQALKELDMTVPTAIQAKTIPSILSGHDVTLASQTGSGKTLAFLLPVLQQLIQDETLSNVHTRIGRPRSLILVPNQELAMQILQVAKQLTYHGVKLRTSVLHGGLRSKQVNRMLKYPIDLLISTPGRLQFVMNKYGRSSHDDPTNTQDKRSTTRYQDRKITKKQQKAQRARHELYLSDVKYLVIDEADTMFDPTNGFGDLLKQVLAPIRFRSLSSESCSTSSSIQCILASASFNGRAHHVVKKLFPRTVFMNEALLHQLPAGLVQKFIVVGNQDKQELCAGLVKEYLSKSNAPSIQIGASDYNEGVDGNDDDDDDEDDGILEFASPTINPIELTPSLSSLSSVSSPFESKSYENSMLIFCNTISSARSLDWFLNEQGYESCNYHGGMTPEQRKLSFAEFTAGHKPIMVATDMAARGLDLTFIDQIINFDFPLNPVDYLHRAGRTARNGMSGNVTSLVTKKDRGLAGAIEQASLSGQPIHSLSSRFSNSQLSFDHKNQNNNQKQKRSRRQKFSIAPEAWKSSGYVRGKHGRLTDDGIDYRAAREAKNFRDQHQADLYLNPARLKKMRRKQMESRAGVLKGMSEGSNLMSKGTAAETRKRRRLQVMAFKEAQKIALRNQNAKINRKKKKKKGKK